MERHKIGDRVELAYEIDWQGVIESAEYDGQWKVQWDNGQTSVETEENLTILERALPHRIEVKDIEVGDTVRRTYTNVDNDVNGDTKIETTVTETIEFVVKGNDLVNIQDKNGNFWMTLKDKGSARWTLLARPETLKPGTKLTEENVNLVKDGQWITQYSIFQRSKDKMIHTYQVQNPENIRLDPENTLMYIAEEPDLSRFPGGGE